MDLQKRFLRTFRTGPLRTIYTKLEGDLVKLGVRERNCSIDKFYWGQKEFFEEIEKLRALKRTFLGTQESYVASLEARAV